MFLPKSAILLLLVSVFSFCHLQSQQPKLILPIGHTNTVVSAEFSPDGKKIVTASADNTAKIWDVQSGLLLFELVGHTKAVNFASFSPDSKNIITVSSDSTAKIWDLVNGRLLADLKGHADIVNSAVYSPGGDKIVTASNDFTAKIWDAKSGLLIISLAGHSDYVNNACFSPDGKMIATSSDDNTANVWSTVNGSLLFVLKGHTKSIKQVAYSFDGNKIITGSADSTAKVWDAGNGSLLAELKGHTAGVTSVCFSHDSQKIVTSSYVDCSAKIWDASTGALLVDLKGHRLPVFNAKFSPDGKKIVTASLDSKANIWDSRNGTILFNLVGHTEGVRSVSFSPDGKKIVTASNDNSCKIWDTNSGKLLSNLTGHTKRPKTIFFSPNDSLLAIASDFNNIEIWDIKNGVLVNEVKGHVYDTRINCFSSDSKKYVSISFENTVEIRDTETKILLNELKGHKSWVYGASFSPDNRRVVSASLDSSAKIWDIQTGLLVAELKGHKGGVFNAFYSPDGQKIVTTSWDHKVKLWDAQTGTYLLTISENFYSINTTSISPDGKMLLIASGEKRPSVWNAQTGAFHYELKGNTDGPLMNDIVSACFSPDSKMILTTSNDHTAKIWGAVNGVPIAEIKSRPATIKSAFFSNDGTKILTSSDDNVVAIWNSQNGKLLAELKSHTRDVTSGIFSNDDKKIVTISRDNTAKIWDTDNGELLFTFFAVDSTDYLVIDKEGRYDGSEGARKLLYYTCGQEVIDLEQFKNLCWEPGLVSKLMGVNKEPITAEKLSEINICNNTPEVEEQGFNDGIYHYKIQPRNGGIGEVQLYINGKLIKKYNPATLLKEGNDYLLSINQKDIQDYFVSGSDNKVLVKATTKEGTMTSRGAEITNNSEKKAKANPNMYIVSIGISKYKGEKLKLGYASKDAIDFASALSAAAQKLLNTDGKQHVITYTFNTETGSLLWPTRKEIESVFDSISHKATADDILVVFFAGHGVLQSNEKNLYLPTAEAISFEQVETMPKEVAISTKELNEWMRKIYANKQLLILDACNSAGGGKDLQEWLAKGRELPADQQRALDNLTSETGSCLLAASATDQSANETSLYDQGLLTYSLLSGIKLGNGLRDNKYIGINHWFSVASDNVKVLAEHIGRKQDPKIFGNANFDVGLVDPTVIEGIKLSNMKKAFRRSKFIQDEELLNDDLDLSALVDKELNKLSARGKESPLAYAPDNTLLDAYSIRGKYEVKGNIISAKVSLIKGQKERVYQFELIGAVDKKEELAEKIIEKMQEFLNKKSN